MLFSSILFWVAVFLAWRCHCVQLEKRKEDPRWTLRRIAARPRTADRLPFSVLSEMAQVSSEQPRSLFALCPRKVQLEISACPAVSYVRVWRLLPGTLGIEYALRHPIARLAGVKNVGVDAQGKLFFLSPFFAPKRLPSIALSVPFCRDLRTLQERVLHEGELVDALELLPLLTKSLLPNDLCVTGVDCSRKQHTNIFRREVVLTLSRLCSSPPHSLSADSGKIGLESSSESCISVKGPSVESPAGTCIATTGVTKADAPFSPIYVRISPDDLHSLHRLPKIFHYCPHAKIVDMRYKKFVIVSEECAANDTDCNS